MDTDGNDVPRGKGGGLLALRRPYTPHDAHHLERPRALRPVLGRDPGRLRSAERVASWDEDGYITVLGRSDDVLNVAGHRIGTADVESA
ncbi:MAG: hypothetical protein R2838_01525 [Caldilineaceae bacterium]